MTILSKTDKESLLRVLSGAKHIYSANAANAKIDDAREFYLAQLVEAERLITLIKTSKGKLAMLEEESDEEEEGDEE